MAIGLGSSWDISQLLDSLYYSMQALLGGVGSDYGPNRIYIKLNKRSSVLTDAVQVYL